MCSIIGAEGYDLPQDAFLEGFNKTRTRGPDMTRLLETPAGRLGFHRLAIMDTNESGMQPFALNGNFIVCNGEIYGFRNLKNTLSSNYTFESGSDCEILLPLYEQHGLDMFAMLDAEFALILYDHERNGFIAARDPIGIRPLYYGKSKDGSMLFASEAKNLVTLTDKVMPFPPGHYYADGKFTCYCDIAARRTPVSDDLDTACTKIREKLAMGVAKRLDADVPVAFLLSGGLDSSLVCAIATRLLNHPIRTFAVGMDTDAIDLKYARQAAEFIKSEHTEVIITRDDVISALETVVALLGTYDITTIRASMGMYLLCKAIHETTDVRVLLTGEISDELFGYK
ncbi:MAG: asparagine synthase-related protein, partial [Bacillota bacterium]